MVGHAKKVTAVGGRCNGHGTGNAQLDVLAAIGSGNDVRQDSNIDSALGVNGCEEPHKYGCQGAVL